MNNLITHLKQLQIKNASKNYFVPEAAFFHLMTDEQVNIAIAESDIDAYRRDEIANQVCRRGKKIFGILILANGASLLQRFIEADQLEDARLPFTEEILTETVGLSDGQAGSGGFGIVYEVVINPDHQTLGNVFPERFVRKEFSKNQSHYTELQNLAVLNTLKHPNIVELLSSYAYDDVRHNLLFPLATHGSLKDFMTKDRQLTGFLSDDSVLTALAGLSSAIKSLHEFFEDKLDLALIGFHHDLQPRNILVTENTFILADFGLSKLKPSDEDSETPFRNRMDDYVAPECEDWENNYEPGPVHRSSDIWSFGCVLAEIVTYVSQSCTGVRDFREARKFKRPGNTHHSFHCGPQVSSTGVTDWLSNLETSSSPSFVLIIQLVKRILSLDPFVRPRAVEVERFLRFVAIHRSVTRIDGRFEQLQEKYPKQLDPVLEMIRFQSWSYAAGVLEAKDVEAKLSHNILDQFNNISEVLLRLEHDIESRLSRENTKTYLDTSQLSKIIDQLHFHLDDRQSEVSRDYFKVSIFKNHDHIRNTINDGANETPPSHEIRMRMNIQDMTRLLDQDSDPHSRSLVIDPSQVDGLRDFGQHHHGTQRNVVPPHQVWVEWRKYAHSTDKETMDKLYDRTAKLSELLSREKPKAMRTMNCTGFMHKPDKQALGLIFDFPVTLAARMPLIPVNLSEVIRGTQAFEDLPDLNSRFGLAHTLAAALFEFHSVGWLHKSLTSDNVIFFKREEDPVIHVELSPWLVGFNHSKPDDPLGFTSGLSETASRMYHHPNYIDIQHGFRLEFDYYSLGIILLEIGHWKPFREMTKTWTGSYEERRQRLLKGRIPNLRKTMGREYSEAVRFCVEAATNLTSSEGDHYKMILSFLERVVIPLSRLPR
ncbi:hypothetical protein FSARC_14634 [Fusarium sarcochroum]|uniref:Protein kinase domain-containing protein n=1 Tax=Fusarium sarcochroum TaxID=1208366 RepID=A0A8H4SS81_9HYPO|nr:hypothetical protein FSARC_14634 [Fusarium sarcochroum]